MGWTIILIDYNNLILQNNTHTNILCPTEMIKSTVYSYNACNIWRVKKNFDDLFNHILIVFDIIILHKAWLGKKNY